MEFACAESSKFGGEVGCTRSQLAAEALPQRFRMPVATNPELDTTTRLQLAVSDLCGLYSNALGRLLNAVEERAGPSEPAIELLAADLGLQVAKAHRGIDDLTDELRRKLRSEATQLQRLRVLELEHSAVTRELRIEVEAAGVLRRVLHA